MKKFLIIFLAAILTIPTAVAFVGCEENTGTAENTSATSETSASELESVSEVSSSAPAESSFSEEILGSVDDSASAVESSSTETSESSSSDNPSGVDDPEDDEQENNVDSFLENLTDILDEVEYSYAGGFYQNKVKEEFVTIVANRYYGVFELNIFDDYKDDCPFEFTLKSDSGTFVTEEGESNMITVSAGETFTWKAGEIGKLVLENSDKSYNTLYTKYYRNGVFKPGYAESQFIDVIADQGDKKVGYGSISFYLTVSGNSVDFQRSRFLFLPKIDGEYQQIDEKKFSKAQYTARVLPENIYTERLQSEFFYFGTGILLYPPQYIADSLFIYLKSETRDILFEKGITLEDIAINPADYGVDGSKLYILIPSDAYLIGYDGVDCGYFQLSIDSLAYSHEEKGKILRELYEHLWTLDFIEYVSFISTSSID